MVEANDEQMIEEHPNGSDQDDWGNGEDDEWGEDWEAYGEEYAMPELVQKQSLDKPKLGRQLSKTRKKVKTIEDFRPEIEKRVKDIQDITCLSVSDCVLLAKEYFWNVEKIQTAWFGEN